MRDYHLKFDFQPCQKLDYEFALLATQIYNLGRKGDWFGCFRGGLYGFYARIYGVMKHYYEVHSWDLESIKSNDPEYHLSSIFFNMDSAIECFVFALNALGYAIDSEKFKDITDEKGLKGIQPINIVGDPNSTDKRFRSLEGYALYFPTLQEYWKNNEELLKVIFEQHDVSKHRSRIEIGGKYRTDAPEGFFESLAIGEDKGLRFNYSPMEEIILMPEPKTPPSKQNPEATYVNFATLEEVAEAFCQFINVSCVKALEDAQNNIKLNHYEFLKGASFVFQTDIDLFEDAECKKKRSDVKGLILATEIIGYGITDKSLVPTTRFSHYKKGKYILPNQKSSNLANIWGETWYIDPEDNEIKYAWQSSAEFIGEQTDNIPKH